MEKDKVIILKSAEIYLDDEMAKGLRELLEKQGFTFAKDINTLLIRTHACPPLGPTK